jgi:nitrogenase-associated protein
MAVVVFYEKPGCCGNAKQKAVLEASGHTVVARSLLDTPWTRMQLRSFLELLPVAQWFNPNASLVKSGEIVPADFDEATALGLFQADPILIRRPLLEVDGVRRAGFDVAAIKDWIGLSAVPDGETVGACAYGADGGSQCGGHEEGHAHEPSPVVES